jgi:hypothetical protein
MKDFFTREIKIADLIPGFNPNFLSHVVCQKGINSHHSGKGNGRMPCFVEDGGRYDFSIKNSEKKPMKLYVTDKNGENLREICNNTKFLGLGSKKTIELNKGECYFLVISEGEWSFSHKYRSE